MHGGSYLIGVMGGQYHTPLLLPHTQTNRIREGNHEPSTNKSPVVDTRHGRAEVAEHKSRDTSSGHSIQRHVCTLRAFLPVA